MKAYIKPIHEHNEYGKEIIVGVTINGKSYETRGILSPEDEKSYFSYEEQIRHYIAEVLDIMKEHGFSSTKRLEASKLLQDKIHVVEDFIKAKPYQPMNMGL